MKLGIQKENSYIAICIFIVLFVILQIVKPTFLYRNNGTLRQFGIGYKNKTVVPIWFITIIIAILSYYLVLYIN